MRLSPEFDYIEIDSRFDSWGDISNGETFGNSGFGSLQDTPKDVLDAEGSYLKAAITLSANLVKADNIYMPTSGYDGESALEFSGMDVDLAKYTIKSTKYTTVMEVPKWGNTLLLMGGPSVFCSRPPKTAFQSLKDFMRVVTGRSGVLIIVAYLR